MKEMLAAQFSRLSYMPPYALGEIAAAVRDARLAGRDIIDLSQVNPQLDPPQLAVDKLIQASLQVQNHRYSASQGIGRLRRAICSHYHCRYGVELNPETQSLVTLGTKEGLAHLMIAVCAANETVLLPTPSYPLHIAAVYLSGAAVIGVPLFSAMRPIPKEEFILTAQSEEFFERINYKYNRTWPRPRLFLCSFPHNPTCAVVTLDFFERLLEFCRKRQMYLVHDFAYADLSAKTEYTPSVLQVRGAEELAVEFYSLSKGFSLPGWRIGFMLGNETLVGALKFVKSYLDFGAFQPLQIAASSLLEASPGDGQAHEAEVLAVYRSRAEVLSRALRVQGWETDHLRATGAPFTNFLWTRTPSHLRHLPSMEICKMMLQEANVAACPGEGFDPDAGEYLRLALIEPEHRLRIAAERMAQLRNGEKT